VISIDFLLKKRKKHDLLPYLALGKAIGGTPQKNFNQIFFVRKRQNFLRKNFGISYDRTRELA